MIGAPRFQNGSLTLLKNKTTPATWFFRFYEERNGRRSYRNQRIGTIKELPHRRDAEKAVHELRANINSSVHIPETVSELISHYKKFELGEDTDKRATTCSVYELYLDRQIEPKWGAVHLGQIRAVDVERWLRPLKFAPASKSKIRNIMSALFAHAKRYGMVQVNPIEAVRCSAKRMREPDVLTPVEFERLVEELPLRERVMVMVAGTTGLRRSELIALTWKDVDFNLLQIAINKSCVHGKIGATKTAASGKPVPLHPDVALALRNWRRVTDYPENSDFLFPSIRNNGLVPVWPDTLLKKVIRPALERAGIRGKTVGWHTFRHSLGTNLRFLGVDIKVAQELLRHANAKITLDLYTQAISSQKREANAMVVEMMLPAGRNSEEPQHQSAPAEKEKEEVEAVNC